MAKKCRAVGVGIFPNRVRSDNCVIRPKEIAMKIVELRRDGTAVLQMEDGRVVPATVKEGLAVKKGQTATFKSEGEDKDGAPLGVLITSVKE